MNIIEAIENNQLFKPAFKDLKTWTAWITFLRVLFALQMDDKELTLFKQCTGRGKPPEKQFQEAVCICGRRSGKSFISSVTALYLSLFFDYTEYLNVGERASVVIIAADRGQSRTIFNYISGILHSTPVLENSIESELKERISLTNRIDIEILTASHRTVRGRTIAAVLMDEAAFFYQEGARPDTEIYRALKPSTATIPNSLILILSSPYMQSGLLYDMHKRFYGEDDPETLVWVADTLTMNPTINKKIIDRAKEVDAEAAESEWFAEFRKDLSTFLDIQIIEDAIVRDLRELEPMADVNYIGFVDPAGGGGKDSMTLAIAHRDRDNNDLILDCIRVATPPFDPYAVTEEFAEVLKQYRCNTVTGDKFTGDWCSTAFEKQGIRYIASTKTKSELYLSVEPLFNRGRIQLLDHPRLYNELRNLERRVRQGGRDLVDHPKRMSDDVANSVCGALVNADTGTGYFSKCSFL